MTTLKTLHILNKAPDHSRAALCLGALNEQDALLLIENGALCLAEQRFLNGVKSRLYILESDAIARGLAELPGNVETIDYPEMVELTASAASVISW